MSHYVFTQHSLSYAALLPQLEGMLNSLEAIQKVLEDYLEMKRR